MNYQEECVAAFKLDIQKQIQDEALIDMVSQAFMSGFEYGSLNGACDSVRQYAIERMTKPAKSLLME